MAGAESENSDSCSICCKNRKNYKLACSHEFCDSCIADRERNNQAWCPQCREPSKETGLICEDNSSDNLKVASKDDTHPSESDSKPLCSVHKEPLSMWCKLCSTLACAECKILFHGNHTEGWILSELDKNELDFVKRSITRAIDDRNKHVKDDLLAAEIRNEKIKEILNYVLSFEEEIKKEKKKLNEHISIFSKGVAAVHDKVPKLSKMKSLLLKSRDVDDSVRIVNKCQKVLYQSDMKVLAHYENSLLSDSICKFVCNLAEMDFLALDPFIRKLSYKEESTNQNVPHLDHGGKWVIGDSKMALEAVDASREKQPSHLEIIFSGETEDNICSDAVYRVLNESTGKIEISIKFLDSFDVPSRNSKKDREMLLICNEYKNCVLESFFGRLEYQGKSPLPKTVKRVGLSITNQADWNHYINNCADWNLCEEIHMSVTIDVLERVQLCYLETYIPPKFIHIYNLKDSDLDQIVPLCCGLVIPLTHKVNFYHLCFPKCLLSYSAIMTLPENLKRTNVKHLHFEMVTPFTLKEKQAFEEKMRETMGWYSGVNWTMDSVFSLN